ncbi:helix-turn-helix transcriptional regulator [Anabaena sp. UHCC 0451]|uniref:helix-turn-helix domain-containing protein n=1 Tax=Anabaena sp. UHCC 0451 TaxID=2055235 RepID=UPI002B1F3933|nr:helix-turn-helix transcriptional regulator [Anabaena sp. UHCC 0451]MEA5577913.1 helix-turn-helix transcriptional regulator [Anabaena sp. UHCC 0451]
MLGANKTVDIKWGFGRAVRKRRRELDLSQEELAEKAELHRTYISSIELGKCNVSLENIEKLAKALNISIPDLFANCSINSES